MSGNFLAWVRDTAEIFIYYQVLSYEISADIFIILKVLDGF